MHREALGQHFRYNFSYAPIPLLTNSSNLVMSWTMTYTRWSESNLAMPWIMTCTRWSKCDIVRLRRAQCLGPCSSHVNERVTVHSLLSAFFLAFCTQLWRYPTYVEPESPKTSHGLACIRCWFLYLTKNHEEKISIGCYLFELV